MRGGTVGSVSRVASASKRWSAALKALPIHDVDSGEWLIATLHADCYVLVEAILYSAPHIHRHMKLRIKVTESHVEIFLNLERLTIHPLSRHGYGWRVKIDAHFPPAPQGILRSYAAAAVVAVSFYPSRTASACLSS